MTPGALMLITCGGFIELSLIFGMVVAVTP